MNPSFLIVTGFLWPPALRALLGRAEEIVFAI
jgi:hypothetical protein